MSATLAQKLTHTLTHSHTNTHACTHSETGSMLQAIWVRSYLLKRLDKTLHSLGRILPWPITVLASGLSSAKGVSERETDCQRHTANCISIFWLQLSCCCCCCFCFLFFFNWVNALSCTGRHKNLLNCSKLERKKSNTTNQKNEWKTNQQHIKKKKYF